MDIEGVGVLPMEYFNGWKMVGTGYIFIGLELYHADRKRFFHKMW